MKIDSGLAVVGLDWLSESVCNLTDNIIRRSPTEFIERFRYLPEAVTRFSGPFSFDLNPYMKEIIDCLDPDHPAREINLKKGVQVTYTTSVLENAILFSLCHIKTLPIAYVTAEQDLANDRREINIIPMLHHSGFHEMIKSHNEFNARSQGVTSKKISVEGGGYVKFFGATNAKKMRQYSFCIMLKDEIDAWPELVGKDGDPDKLTDDRTSGYHETRKIFRGSTPLISGISKIDYHYERGDKRQYFIRCKRCGSAQYIRWKNENGAYQFCWEMENDDLIRDSVAYVCRQCGFKHYEYDKTDLFDPDNGAEWRPTKKPAEPDIRSYNLPAFYSPIGFKPWHKCVQQFLDGFDPKTNRVTDVNVFQVFYNNILAKSFEVVGQKVSISAATGHRRVEYKCGEVPNRHSVLYGGGDIRFLTCCVDVHKDNLAVAVFAWANHSKCYLVDYWRFEDDTGSEDGCTSVESSVWDRLDKLICDKEYTADDGGRFKIFATFIDANFATDTVLNFCARFTSNVYPIIGAANISKKQRVQEFGEWHTPNGLIGYRIIVDHYKDRLAPVLKRRWTVKDGIQKPYHFNVPFDITETQLSELTKETKRKEVDKYGQTKWNWYRVEGSRNELWDLLVYGHAGVEIIAWKICIDHFKLQTVDWPKFWQADIF